MSTSTIAFPLPTRPATRPVTAVETLAARRGVSVVVSRSRNAARWAVTLGAGDEYQTISGPYPGRSANPSNTELANDLEQAVTQLCPDVGEVYASDTATAELLERKTSLQVSSLFPPCEALRAAATEMEAIESRLVEGLVLACDASLRRGHTLVGCGWVLAYKQGADPIVGARAEELPTGGILAGELAAMRRGLQNTVSAHPVLRRGVGSLSVLTDSKPALALLDRVRKNVIRNYDDMIAVREAQRILGLARGANVSFAWVRGHNGHSLNELADRLAVLARRNAESGTPDEAVHDMMVRVREDARQQLQAA